MKISQIQFVPRPLITNTAPELQKVDLLMQVDFNGHIKLRIYQDNVPAGKEFDLPVAIGRNKKTFLLPPPSKNVEARVIIVTPDGTEYIWQGEWKKPRDWELYFVLSSHTDIGLHNSQYVQRYQSANFIDKAIEMEAQAEQMTPQQPYHYMVEGTWIWNNYAADHGKAQAEKVRDEYILPGKFGVFSGIAGNFVQVFGLEEMCRSSYVRRELKDQWGIDSRTMAMIDNNGLSWAMVAPFAEAGYENLLFSPNQWAPLKSSVWTMDVSKRGGCWNPDAGGGGSRIDVRYDSALPMVFYWLAPDKKNKLLVWSTAQYTFGGMAFGLYTSNVVDEYNIEEVEDKIEETLALLEEKYPWNFWLTSCYADDEEPNLRLTKSMAAWNKKWKWPRLQSLGDPNMLFDRLRKEYDAQIPCLSGDITGGWYQLPPSAPDYLSDKFEADRTLPNVEKLSTIAAMENRDYQYPADAFTRAWKALLFNDEHSYGTSGYSGRKVYETWMQHRDWIDYAAEVNQTESCRAFRALAEKIDIREDSILLFNPAAFPRKEIIAAPDGKPVLTPEIPAFGYKAVPQTKLHGVDTETVAVSAPPVLENNFYKISFGIDGSCTSIYDKELQRELLDPSAPFRGNQFVYTQDNHKTFVTPGNASFVLRKNALLSEVEIRMAEPCSKAAITTLISLPAHEKRIDIVNQLDHVKDLFNTNRYYRYGYYAFPFLVENAVRRVHLNGCVASPGTAGQTGHGTETYLAAREWSCVENDSFGVALLQMDSQLVEFDHIHPDKTDAFMNETGSAIYSYLFNDWLQKQIPGGSHINLKFRYTITSYDGDYKTPGLLRMAERMANPLMTSAVSANSGTLPPEKSYLHLPEGLRLQALKRAEDGNGIILRLKEVYGAEIQLPQILFARCHAVRNTVDERPMDETGICLPYGTATYRLTDFQVPEIKLSDPILGDTPAAIGSWYTGLITKPRAGHSGDDGVLYLIWGQNMEPDLSHYELYRSLVPGFIPGKENFLARVEPGPYRTGIYEDTGLENHTCYYYRVRAVNQNGIAGPFSDEFSGITRESYDSI